MLFGKRRLLKRLEREHAHMLRDLHTWMTKEEERARLEPELKQHQSNITALYRMLAPHDSLDWTAFFIRTGLAILIFFLLIAPPYTFYAQQQFLNPIVPVTVMGKEYMQVTAFVPETPVVADDWASFEEADRPEPVRLESFATHEGRIVGFVQQPDYPYVVLWTAPDAQRHTLFLRTYTNIVEKMGVQTRPLLQDAVYQGIATMRWNGTESVLAYATDERTIRLQRFDKQWNKLGEPAEVTLAFKDESIDGFTVSWARDTWILGTVIDPPGGGSTLAHRDPVLRQFDASLQKRQEMRLTTDNVHGGAYPQVVADEDAANPGGWLVFQPTSDVLKKARAEIGDALQAWKVDAKGEVIARRRLTTPGMRHHFMTSDVAVEDMYYVLTHQQQVPPWYKADTGYVSSTGRAIILAYDKTLQRATGFVWVRDVPPVTNPLERRGVSHARFLKKGNVVFTVYDYLMAEDPETGKPRRDIMLGKVVTE